MKFKILFNRKFGFRNIYLTNHALINLVELIKKYLDNDYYVCGVFIKLQKEFGNHDNLLERLEYYGICGLDINWLSSLLKNSKQHVSLHGISSSTNDLQYAFLKSIIYHFVDDTNLIFSSKKSGTIESVINNELKHLVQWIRGNKLSLNETKS